MVGTFLGLLVLVVIASFFWDEPLRRDMEERMNASLKGYSVLLPRAHFNLIGMSVDLTNLTVRQQAHPEPPVAVFPKLHASLQWRELARLHLVADFLFDGPRIYVNLPQLEREIEDPTPVKDKGWQQALEQIYPFKINLLRVRNGEVTYIDTDPKRPLKVTGLAIRADNIRNIHSRDHVYPSPVHAEGTIFGTGRGALDGHADFLAEPFPGFHALVRLQQVPLDYFRPMVARSNLTLKGGVLDTDGEVEHSPKVTLLHLKNLTISNLRADFVHTAATAAEERAKEETVKRAAKKSSNRPGTLLKVDEFQLARSDIGFVNEAKSPAYRVFVEPVDLTITNLSNHFSEGPAVARASGKFMGSGPATATARFRPDTEGADFDLKVSIEKTDLTTMNNLLRAYGKFDVVAGTFSFYTELQIAKGQITGYVKTLFADMKVYDKRQDADKSFFRKAYEAIVGGVAKLLENRPRAEVATVADISGRVDNPRSNTWQVIGRLIENAFFHAILPGFDREISSPRKTPTPRARTP